MNKLTMMMAALALAGCCTCNCEYDAKDPVVGNWGLDLGFDFMPAGHMIASRDNDGNAQALVLWRWASPTKMKDVKFEGNKFSFTHPWGDMKVTGEVKGCKLTATCVKQDGTKECDIKGWRNPPVDKTVSTKDAKFGEPIDLLANGLADWEAKESTEKNNFGWTFKDGVLSNRIKHEEGKGNCNLISKRADFYDFNLNYDVRVPEGCNSGMYLRGRYEIQTIDSYGKPVNEHNMAAFYGRIVPSVAAEKKPGEWQHVEVTLYKRHVTVVLNGTTIIDNAVVEGVTGGAIDANEFVPGPMYIQGDHSDADYRNVILKPAID